MHLGIFQGISGLAALERACASATRGGVDFLILPELFLTGYNIGAARLRELAEPVDGASAVAAAAIARRYGVDLL